MNRSILIYDPPLERAASTFFGVRKAIASGARAMPLQIKPLSEARVWVLHSCIRVASALQIDRTVNGDAAGPHHVLEWPIALVRQLLRTGHTQVTASSREAPWLKPLSGVLDLIEFVEIQSADELVIVSDQSGLVRLACDAAAKSAPSAALSVRVEEVAGGFGSTERHLWRLGLEESFIGKVVWNVCSDAGDLS